MNQFNFELFYEDDITLRNDLNQSIKQYTIRRVYDLSTQPNITAYEKITNWDENISTFNKIEIGNNCEQCDESIFKKYYRHRNPKTHSKVFDFTPIISIDNKQQLSIEDISQLTITVEVIRGPVNVVIAQCRLYDKVSPSSEVVEALTHVVQDTLPNSKNGRITGITPLKIALKNNSYNIPFRKLLPQFTSLKYCKLISKYLPQDKIIPFEYKWVKLKTGIILVRERYGELVNPITNNKIDTIYVQDVWPAFATDDLLYILGEINVDVYNGNRADQLAEEVVYRLHRDVSFKNQLKSKLISYHGRRIKYIEEFEREREAKRSLSNMNKQDFANINLS